MSIMQHMHYVFCWSDLIVLENVSIAGITVLGLESFSWVDDLRSSSLAVGKNLYLYMNPEKNLEPMMIEQPFHSASP
jgi:hypothetical protein